MALDEDKLMDFLHRFVGDLGATITAGGVVIGHRLGLYKALAGEPATADDLAARTDCDPRYVAEWLRGQAAGGYVSFDADRDLYTLTEEQAFVLADPDGAVYAPGAFVLALGALQAEPRVTEAFRTGAGIGWHEHDDGVFVGWLPREPGAGLDPGAGRRRGEAVGRRPRRRYRLRARSVDDPARRAVPAEPGDGL